MASRDEITTVAPHADPFRSALVVFEMAVAILYMLIGLRQWGIIVGLVSPSFEAMPAPLKIATMFLAVADLVAAVGLWMRVAWGRVLFVTAAVSDIALHTAFVATFGTAWILVGIQAVLLVVYATLAVLSRRQPAKTA